MEAAIASSRGGAAALLATLRSPQARACVHLLRLGEQKMSVVAGMTRRAQDASVHRELEAAKV
jgi:hypothetical protein